MMHGAKIKGADHAYAVGWARSLEIVNGGVGTREHTPEIQTNDLKIECSPPSEEQFEKGTNFLPSTDTGGESNVAASAPTQNTTSAPPLSFSRTLTTPVLCAKEH